MPRPHPLPESLPDAFTVATARDLGIPWARLGRSDLAAPFHGVRVRVGEGPPDDPGPALLARCLHYAPRLRPGQFFSHETALRLRGAPMPSYPYLPGIHVSAHRPAREPRVRGVVGHRLQVREPAVRPGAHGLPAEHPVRAWRQAGVQWALDDLIAAAEFLVSGDHPPATVAELRDEVEEMGDVRRGVLSRALDQIRVGARSPRETSLRLLLARAGLPEPEINWTLRDAAGAPIAELDLAYPRFRVAPEYDGRVHADDPVQFARDGDRWERIRAAGWEHVRIMNHHMRDGGREAVEKVRRALLRAGWSSL